MIRYTSLNALLIKPVVTALFFCCINGTAAQSSYGVLAGAGKTSLYQFPFSTTDYNRYNSTTSFWTGIKADIALNKKGINMLATAVYNKRGFNYLLQNETGFNNTLKDSSYKQQLHYIDIHLMLLKKFSINENSSFFAGTGPSLNLFMNGSEQTELRYFGNMIPNASSINKKLTVGDIPGAYKKMFLGWGFAAGVEIKKVSIWLQAGIPLDYYYQDVSKAVKHKLKTFGLTVSYNIFTHKKVNTEEEEVTEIVRVVKVDSLADRDGDGILDKNDRCPGIKGVTKYNGCPIPDTDGDGINDDNDKCITVAGIAVNQGCPAFIDTAKAAVKDSACYTIYFEPAKFNLRSNAYQGLSEVVRQLKANPKLVVVVNGHTDNSGTEAANYQISLDRAKACAAYIASFYIDKKRVFVNAYGVKLPAADLNDPLLQWKNRRVEVCVFERKQ
jgi:outer membrane protein OmpA-like peptidoglycan-associated protein